MTSRNRVVHVLAAAVLASLALAGCTNAAPSSTGGGSSAARGVTVDSAAASDVPAAIKDAGVVRVGIDATYAPNEFKDANGKATGWASNCSTRPPPSSA